MREKKRGRKKSRERGKFSSDLDGVERMPLSSRGECSLDRMSSSSAAVTGVEGLAAPSYYLVSQSSDIPVSFLISVYSRLFI